MKNLVLAVLAAMLMIGEAVAQANALGTSRGIRNPSAPLTSLDAEALIPLIQQMGLAYDGVTFPSGERVLLVTAPNGTRFQITPMACDDRGRCRGMHIVTLFQTEVDERTVAAFNYRYAFVSAGLSGDNVAYLSRYEVADFGMPRGNVAVTIRLFLETAALFSEQLGAATGDLQKPPAANDLSANGLNMQSLWATATLFEEQPAPAPRHPHVISFEETARMIDTFVRAEAIYPGRIMNPIEE
ncbi:MAG: YbjN domain-containing protein [Pseudomonadota bacterium]